MAPWRGVNLGGWLLLEPGPAGQLFKRHPNPKGSDDELRPRCEWDLMQILKKTVTKAQSKEVMRKHRETHITKKDFEKIRDFGLNAVRLPIGYWIVLGPSEGDIYDGPALDIVDLAVNWAEECGLQIVLDLHGCPGGESGEAPCGRRRRPDGAWNWHQWRFGESLKALKVLALRYHMRKCVTGIAVCNEPSNTVPTWKLSHYYEKAISTVRDAGMHANQVAVMLPLFQRSEEEFLKYWDSRTGGKHQNICFDMHFYHCFENDFNGKTLAEQLRAVQTNVEFLRKHPIVIGEWSLALGNSAWSTCGNMPVDDVYRIFASAQLEGYKEASHGWFFWNYTEADAGEWNFQKAHARGLLKDKPYKLPRWSGAGEDPLEEELHPTGPEARVFYGEGIYFRTWYGRYLENFGPPPTYVGGHWSCKEKWQRFCFLPSLENASSESAASERREIRNGDIVRVRSGASGRFFTVGDDKMVTCVPAREAIGKAAEFVVQLKHGQVIKHRSIIHLQSRLTNAFLDCDETAEGVFVRYKETSTWQSFAVEKNPDLAPAFCASKKRMASAVTPVRKHRYSAASVSTVVVDDGYRADVRCTPPAKVTPSRMMLAKVTPAKRRRLAAKHGAVLAAEKVLGTSCSKSPPKRKSRAVASGASSNTPSKSARLR